MGIQINGQTDTVTAIDGSINVGGNVTIPGVLTYEDVTNVDSVGIITAQAGIRVTGGSIGIEQANPHGKLHVYTDSLNADNGYNGQNFGIVVETEDGNNDGDEGNGICFTQQYSSDGIDSGKVRTGAIIGFKDQATGNFGGGLKFKVQPFGASPLRTSMVLDKSGNIGINTTTPVAPLEIQGVGGVNDSRITFTRHGTPANNSVIGELFYRIGTDSVAGIGAYRQSAIDDAYLAFFTQPTGGSYGERLRITSGGNIGIGTTNPGSKLAVHGSITESTDGVTYYPVVTQQDVGLDQNQIPLNQNLGGMAYMDTSNYEQVFEIPATDVTSYFKANTEDIWIGMEGHAPSSVAWPSGSLNQIDVWEIDFQLTYPNMTSGRNDLWMLMYYHNGSSITTANSVEWNNWVLARSTYAGTNTGWNQIQAASGTNWGKLANYMDAKLFSGKILFYRGGTNDFTGSNAGQRTGVMWQFNYTHGGVGSTLAFGSAHPTTPSPSQPLAGFKLNADPESAGTVDSDGNSQVFGGYIRQRGFRLQGNI